MTDLAEFLLARIAEDEERGRSLVAQWWDVGNACQSCGTNGKRILAECEAKRRIVAYADTMTQLDRDRSRTRTSDAWVVLTALALPYADHPEYREEWRP